MCMRILTNRLLEQGITAQGIKIGDDVWIGAGAIITDGVHIGNGRSHCRRRCSNPRCPSPRRGGWGSGKGPSYDSIRTSLIA